MNTETVFTTLCPKCAQQFAAPLASAGQNIICPHCQRQVMLPAEPPRAGVIEPQPAPILISPKGMSIPVERPSVVTALNIIGALQMFGGFFAIFTAGAPLGVAVIISGVFTVALAELVTYAHATAQRLARLEMFLQDAVNQRR